ncbi:MAG: phosphoribosylformylglycinamidine synthase subunit PurQ [Bacteroidetes bacterium]|nr:phosphoribosylformylglycinamidine synthase subunit PurQ [Bacteroidota bacterium]
MKFGVVVFPGSNCDEDMVYALSSVLKQPVVKLWHKEHTLQDCDFIILPGGFSYGDYLRSGALARYSPIMQEVISFANKGGYVMGICNGFQILCESHLLPGALLRNDERLFKCKNVYIKADNNNTPMTVMVPENKALKIPIAHGEGRFYCDTETLQTINNNGQILFKYCDENGVISADSNPNGSLENIAGICNAGKNVFGMMPHPERAVGSDLGNH